ncbi:MAG: FG-GAP-like repeat-containing protein [Saprospiraceae bacterium]
MKNFHFIFAFVLCHFFYFAQGQPTFKNETFSWWDGKPPRSPIPAAIVDIDGDFSDEVIAIDQGLILKCYQYTDKKLELQYETMVSNSVQWTLTAGDIKNLGKNSIITAGVYNDVTLTTLTENNLQNVVLPSSIYAQGSSTIDVNNDGMLDLFICHDEGYPIFFINNGTSLVLENIIEFKINDTTDGSGNYGAEWTDINNDGLADLYISKCRAGVTDPSDQRRINKLFINKGNTIFEESATKYNLDSGSQSWASTFGDLDNDGDNDVIVINHEDPHVIYQNIDGNTCQPITLDKNIETFGFQSLMRDLDNDGLLDILVSGIGGLVLYHNIGNLHFKIYEKFLNPSRMMSMNAGDINDDGLIDLYGHIAEPINSIGYADDEIWINSSVGNNFVKFNLIGTRSNRNAIGAKLEIYGEFGYQQRLVKGGESYGIMNSFQQHFGLGSTSMIDSLIVHWPSGIRQKFSNIQANDTYVIEENGCITAQSIRKSEIIFVSDENPVEVLASQIPMKQYIWSNHDTTSSISISKPGKYSVQMRDSLGCLYISKPILAKSLCLDPEIDLIEDKSLTVCHGDDLVINPPSGKTYIWSDGSDKQELSVNQSGIYALTLTDFCDVVHVDTFSVDIFRPVGNYKGDTILMGDTGILTSSNPKTLWYDSADQSNLQHIGPIFITENLDSSRSYFVTSLVDIATEIGNVGIVSFPSVNQYSANAIDGNMIFNTYEKCSISSVKVGTDTPGIRRILIKDNTGTVVYSKDFFIDSGFSELQLDAILEKPGEYKIGTDVDINIENLGYKSPRLIRTQGSTNYPYRLSDAMILFSTDGGPFYYYYFYDWKVEYDFITCSTVLDSVVVVVQKPDATEDARQKKITIYPNPAQEIIYIGTVDSGFEANIYNSNGQLLKTITNNNTVNIRDWLPGMYIIKLSDKNGYSSYTKFIKSP